MPYSEIAIRLHDPKDYEYFRRKPVPNNHHWAQKFGKDKVDYIYGMDKKTKTLEIQAVRIKVSSPNQYSKEEIENYIKERGLNPIKIEMPKKYTKSLFEKHIFEMNAEPAHLPGTEYVNDIDSSIIESIEIDFYKNVMKLTFAGGDQYIYSSVPAYILNNFKFSVSKGEYFHDYIRGNYPFKKI
jgi:hypothetical protein